MKTENMEMAGFHQELLSVMSQFYYIIERLDLLNDTVCTLQCDLDLDMVEDTVNWTERLEKTADIFLGSQKKDIIKKLSSEHLLELYKAGEKFYSVDGLYLKDCVLNSMTCTIFFSTVDGNPIAYLMGRNSSSEKLGKYIADLYVKNNCDFLIYLDAEHDSYTPFDSGNQAAPFPEELHKGYTENMKRYVETIVVQEDRKQAIRDLSIDWIVAQLKYEEVYSVYLGCKDSVRGYTRKCFKFHYYEKGIPIILMSCSDVTEMYMKEQAGRQALFDALKSAQTDMMTGLLNYKGTVEQITEALAKKPEHAALLFLDVDNFKTVNDSLGHVVGDEVLCQIAVILCEESYGNPLIGRLGGDEFVVFFSEIESREEVEGYAQRVCEAVLNMEYGQKPDQPHISCSIGIVEVPKDGVDYQTLIKKADDMTYRAKFTGKNKFVFYEKEE